MRTYFEQYAADVTRFSDGDWATGRMLDKLPQLHKRNLVNTYVWTADGGLFAETEETMDSQQEMIGGSYAFKGMAGIYTDFTLALFGIGAKFEADAMFGGHLNLAVNKTQASSSSFAMNISLDNVECDIYERDKEGEIVVEASDPKRQKPIKQPGKVDAYRFMSFYLEPQSDHCEDFFKLVVDPIWLEQSDDPGAVALRGARDENKNPACWRILHRVTYVSRILPPLDLSAPPSLEKTLLTLDIDSNYELIKQLEPYVRDHVADFADFCDAVDNAIKTYLPELMPHEKEVKAYLSLYYGIDEGFLPEPQVEGFDEGTESRPAPNKPPSVKAGQYDVVLPKDGSLSINLAKASAHDDRLVKTEDLFLTWEFLPNAYQNVADVTFDDQHILATKAKFIKNGQYRLRLTASDGILSASDETVITVNQAPEIQSITAKKLAPKDCDKARSCVELDCVVRTGIGDLSNPTSLVTKWAKVSGSDGESFDNPSPDLQKDENDVVVVGVIVVKTKATFQQSGYYLLEFTVDNGIEMRSQINLEIAARVTHGLQALYTFETKQGATVDDVSGSDPALNLVVSNPDAAGWVDHGLALKFLGILSGAGDAKRLTGAIRSSNALTLEAWIIPPKGDTPGLRRILTLSDGPAARNFILAQNGNNYHVGLRTTDASGTDANASLKSLAGGTANPNELMHVVFTRVTSGEALLYINGNVVASRTIGGDFSRWDDVFQLALGNEFSSNDRSDRAWSGEYHLVAIYDRALTSDEITQNYEFGADRDLPPQVFAGEDRDINWSVEGVKNSNADGGLIVSMRGRVTHDRPILSGASTVWTQVSGPEKGVTFGQVAAMKDVPTTKAIFTKSGKYVLRLTASDGVQVVSKEVKVNITHEVPVVKINITDTSLIVTDKGVNAVTLVKGKASLKLQGIIKNSLGDDYPVGKRNIQWSGNGVDFGSTATNVSAVANFDKNDVYMLTLKAVNNDDETKTASTDVYITVNQAPVVEIGPDQVIVLPAEAILDATVSDDGLPNPPGILDLAWTASSDKVTLQNPKADYTKASFKDKGTYKLKLTASDGAAKSEAEVTIIANKAPVVKAGEKEDNAIAGLNVPITLNGSIIDEGFGNENQRKPISVTWRVASSPAKSEPPVFGNTSELKTTVTFHTIGEYVLEMSADNKYGIGRDTVTYKWGVVIG
ncbi:Concanavalin A-like lectin/glucanases superfamily protein [uncultured archaeon]|nr:Concanavalin A-like lectin/glucanases superfamily protein [uncultured archaeon]